ncbi:MULTISPECIES: hypothetical protein [unclassified Clostridioides]|uniref:hypothetical protein n=1 Tax=unclassified Clostridioides TaxID=2635829 RepID=UPI001D0C74EC|nr:hypothetical protein [Clostridioides sp. ES-S-0001-02]MCC0640206.1 hypothetical protein [Clostridioides sp. ES-S-0049-03]MCC0652013.1 hypothetical protein [Clostridioides sp. ES-S-0001-03]MCC0657818.1 hypothetical protein [Clostridioides sp. ES-S-0123-01]MCC0673329.1 hypothetical protein [Clostridioides sp. ES-S-0145-01]MCC0674571.1 hypothetical protein [Clostridioides sp. ES-W-0018-02]MCC0694393.1 hypothetical protein [Clostridioides sp. ES-S-0048-02]MCC0710613.1 hypothetical protein [Cl
MDRRLINDKSFYPNNIYPAIDFLKIKRQLKSIYVYEIEQLFKSQVENFSISKLKN